MFDLLWNRIILSSRRSSSVDVIDAVRPSVGSFNRSHKLMWLLVWIVLWASARCNSLRAGFFSLFDFHLFTPTPLRHSPSLFVRFRFVLSFLFLFFATYALRTVIKVGPIKWRQTLRSDRHMCYYTQRQSSERDSDTWHRMEMEMAE